MFLLDTSILVHYVRNDALSQRIEAAYSLMTAASTPLISVVSEGEIRALARELGWGSTKRRALENLLRYFTVIPLPFADVVERYVEVSEHSRRSGRVLGKNDLKRLRHIVRRYCMAVGLTWIAATATATGATLLTTDKDFDHLDPALLTRNWVNPTL